MRTIDRRMKTVAILGHFAFGINDLNGQTIKTKIIADLLTDQLGPHEISFEDTHGRWMFLLRLPLAILRVLLHNRNVIIMPAYKGVRVITPLLVTLNTFFQRRLHYVVIGGWLPNYTRRFPILRFFLKRLHYIYVETNIMKLELEQQNFQNVYIMPNCKPLAILSENQLPVHHPPYKLCTFSRVIKEKGIEEAVKAVAECNQRMGKTVYTLDIYGQIEQQEWFEELMERQPAAIVYKGVVPFDQSTDILKDYFLLLFPTYYRGEAFAGTLIDAMAAGVPTIASNWHSNSEIIEDGKTGRLFPVHSVESLVEILTEAAEHPDDIQRMRGKCISQAKNYQPDAVVQILLDKLVS